MDEVKDTPSALANSVKKGDQLARQIEWLEYPVGLEEPPYIATKQVGYFAQAPEPHFENVLSTDVIENFALLERAQHIPGLSFIRIAKYRFTVKQLGKMYDDAIAWLGANRDKYEKPSEASVLYFGNVEAAMHTLEKGNLPWND